MGGAAKAIWPPPARAVRNQCAFPSFASPNGANRDYLRRKNTDNLPIPTGQPEMSQSVCLSVTQRQGRRVSGQNQLDPNQQFGSLS